MNRLLKINIPGGHNILSRLQFTILNSGKSRRNKVCSIKLRNSKFTARTWYLKPQYELPELLEACPITYC